MRPGGARTTTRPEAAPPWASRMIATTAMYPIGMTSQAQSGSFSQGMRRAAATSAEEDDAGDRDLWLRIVGEGDQGDEHRAHSDQGEERQPDPQRPREADGQGASRRHPRAAPGQNRRVRGRVVSARLAPGFSVAGAPTVPSGVVLLVAAHLAPGRQLRARRHPPAVRRLPPRSQPSESRDQPRASQKTPNAARAKAEHEEGAHGTTHLPRG